MSRIMNKKVAICLLSLVLGFVVSALSMVAYAYFSKKEIYDGYVSGNVELLFDRLDEEGMAAYGSAEGITASEEADWGTRENPYVISNEKHLYNLSELQKLGYFEKKHLSKNTQDDLTNIPYFLICTPKYTPVVIDDSSAKAISPIGTGKYPFIGSVKGVTGTEALAVGKTGNTSTTSVLHAVTVKGDPNDPDVGLFGYVGFLGEPPAEGSEETVFAGTPSVISNVVLSDVSVTVNSTIWDKVEAFVDDIAVNATNGHRYSFSELVDTDDYDKVPHENHHIGILAGHVSYSTVEYISVFYSSADVVAIDLSDESEVGGVRANYLSAAGILGYIYNMNPKFDSEGNIIADSGDSLGDLSYSMIGGGGGLEVGDKPGYILASDMYEKYGYIDGSKITDGNPLKISAATDENGNSLCKEWDGGITLGDDSASYYFYDGVFTFALSSVDDVIEQTWQNDTPPEFGLGENSADGWVTNYEKGQKSVAAYLSKVTSDRELQDAIKNNLPLVIMKEYDSGEGAFMMKLYDQSTDAGSGAFNVRYTTGGASRNYATDDYIDTLFESLEGSPEEFVSGFANAHGDEDAVRELLSNVKNDKNEWKLINLNATTGEMTEDEMNAAVAILREQFKISSKFVDGEYSYFSGNTPVTVNASGARDYYDYADSGYDGYIYYVRGEIGLFTYKYTYYWQGNDGEARVITEVTVLWGQFDINDHLTATGENWQGESVYSKTVDGVTYKGVVVNATEGQFHGKTDNTAVINGQYLHKLTGNAVTYFYSPLGDENYYYMTDSAESGTPIKLSELEATGERTAAGLPYYRYTDDGGTTYTGILLDRYFIYNFYSDKATADTSDDNYLRIVKARFTLSGTKYTLWNGTDTEAVKTSNFKGLLNISSSSVDNRINATVRFNDDGSCYIQYGFDTTSQFVNYNGSAFNTSMSSSDSTKMCIYILEDTQVLNYGSVTFDPKDGTDGHILNAGEYVFWPEADSVNVGEGATPSSLSGVDTQYSVFKLEDLAWKNGDVADNGGILHKGNLLRKFRMIDGIAFGLNLDLGFTNLGTGGLIRAPVGPEGTYTDIPSGGIAFKVNKTTTEPQKIRVLIAVPISEHYVGDEDFELGSYDRYFCLWEMEENDGSGSAIFQAKDYIERFQIPCSYPYQPGTTPSSEKSKFVTVTYKGTSYRCYLNGDRILVAYEFKVYNEGVYVLGTSTSTSDGDGITLDKDYSPMEIVYFSADGVASSGRDGQNGSQLGTVDYVYSYNNIIVPVEERSSTNDEGNEDYSTYYPSYCMLYMNSLVNSTSDSYADVWKEEVYIRRYVTDEENPASSSGYITTKSKSIIAYKLGADTHTSITQYSRLADNVRLEE